MGVTYSSRHNAQAKQEASLLVTLDLTGRFAKQSGVQFQGTVHPDDYDKVWAFFEWLINERTRKNPDATPAVAAPVEG